MSKLNWRKAQLQSLRSLSLMDEEEFRSRDAAARWLEQRKKKPGRRKSARKGARA